MRYPRNEIQNADNAINAALESSEFFERGYIARAMLKSMRDLVEHVAMFVVHRDNLIQGDYYQQIKAAVQNMKERRETLFISDFHNQLQKVISHYTPSEESAERLLIGYYEQLLLLRSFARDKLGIGILRNLELFPLDIDSGLFKYYKQIAENIDIFTSSCSADIGSDRYYIHSVKPFFVNSNVYYEISLLSAYDMSSKFDRIVAFSSFKIPTNYAIRLSIKTPSIDVLGIRLTIHVIDGWEISIRPCELNNLLSLFGARTSTNVNGQQNSYKSLMRLLTETGLNLVDIVSMDDAEFNKVKMRIVASGDSCPVHRLLDAAHLFLLNNQVGRNIIRYLLYKPRNRIIKQQLDDSPNEKLNGLYVKYGCIPFEHQPYCMALLGHEPAAADLFRCINPADYIDNQLARFISHRTQEGGALYIDDSEAEGFANLDELIRAHNETLYYKHKERSIVHEMGQLFIKGNEIDVAETIRELSKMSCKGIRGYKEACESWLSNYPTRVDDGLKEKALLSMFAETRVALIYGSAGTGKTTMVNILCSALSKRSKIAIANTNPAVDSLRRKISDSKCEFMTVTKYLQRTDEADILIIDECSTISNMDIRKIVNAKRFKILLLVGDIRQIEAIRLGNWFELAREFLPKRCIHEFTKPWRASNEDLSRLWESVRENRSDVLAMLESSQMSSSLDESLWSPLSGDEVVLCLNYDGLYGINNVNRLMQIANTNKAVYWNLRSYKAGDPVLFNDSRRFFPVLYNNLKGRIVAIDAGDASHIVFDVQVELALSELDLDEIHGLEYIDCTDGKTTVRFEVWKDDDPDREEERLECIVPFQIAYAVSVHKAQGLEYSSVKLIVTKDVEKRITHNIFIRLLRARGRD